MVAIDRGEVCWQNTFKTTRGWIIIEEVGIKVSGAVIDG